MVSQTIRMWYPRNWQYCNLKFVNFTIEHIAPLQYIVLIHGWCTKDIHQTHSTRILYPVDRINFVKETVKKIIETLSKIKVQDYHHYRFRELLESKNDRNGWQTYKVSCPVYYRFIYYTFNYLSFYVTTYYFICCLTYLFSW